MAAAGFSKLPLVTQTVYARLLDLLLAAEAGVPASGASLVSKTIRGRRYWYAQRREGGKRVQRYIGSETPEVEALLERWRQARSEAASRAELVAMARAGGATVVGAAEAQVLERLSPVFRIGGVLVGSHAFAVLGNMLGVRWQEAIVRTEDVDIAHDHRIAVALAGEGQPTDMRKALGDSSPRFSALNPTYPATAFRVRGTGVEVEVLTPMVGGSAVAPSRYRPSGLPRLLCDSWTTSLRRPSPAPCSAAPVSWSMFPGRAGLPCTSSSWPRAADPLACPRPPRIAPRPASCSACCFRSCLVKSPWPGKRFHGMARPGSALPAVRSSAWMRASSPISAASASADRQHYACARASATNWFRLSPRAIAFNASFLCMAGGILTTNFPLYLLPAWLSGSGIFPSITSCTKSATMIAN